MNHIRYKLTNEFFVVILIAFAIAVIDIAIYLVFPMDMKVLLAVAGVMSIIAFKYLFAAMTTYIVISPDHIKIREYGPLNLTYKYISNNKLNSAVLIGQTLTIYYNVSKSIDVELGDMKPFSALLFAEHLQSLGLDIKKPGDSYLEIKQKEA